MQSIPERYRHGNSLTYYVILSNLATSEDNDESSHITISGGHLSTEFVRPLKKDHDYKLTVDAQTSAGFNRSLTPNYIIVPRSAKRKL